MGVSRVKYTVHRLCRWPVLLVRHVALVTNRMRPGLSACRVERRLATRSGTATMVSPADDAMQVTSPTRHEHDVISALGRFHLMVNSA